MRILSEPLCVLRRLTGGALSSKSTSSASSPPVATTMVSCATGFWSNTRSEDRIRFLPVVQTGGERVGADYLAVQKRHGHRVVFGAEREDAGLPLQADELKDVGQAEVAKGSFQRHAKRPPFFDTPAGSEGTRSAPPERWPMRGASTWADRPAPGSARGDRRAGPGRRKRKTRITRRSRRRCGLPGAEPTRAETFRRVCCGAARRSDD